MFPSPYSALIDSSTNALLTLTQNVPIIAFLAETPMEAEHMFLVNYPNYRKEFKLAKADPATYPEWTWRVIERLFVPTPKELLTDRLRRSSLLAVKKSWVLFEIARALATARYSVWRGIIMQETVYAAKKTQAQRFKDEGYPDDDILQYPYILQFAEFSGLTLMAAADEILLKAKLDDEVLLKSEYFRLKYYNLLKNTMEIALIDPIIIEFRREFYPNFPV